jgi:hypothetical protein
MPCGLLGKPQLGHGRDGGGDGGEYMLRRQ